MKDRGSGKPRDEVIFYVNLEKYEDWETIVSNFHLSKDPFFQPVLHFYCVTGLFWCS